MNGISEFFEKIFSTEGFHSRWLSGEWTPFHGWFYIFSDLGIWCAYSLISIVLLYFVFKRRDIPFPLVFVLFAAFLFIGGCTSLVDAMMFWWPAYRLAALFYFATALISWITVLVLIPSIPEILSLKSPAALEGLVQTRTQELHERTHALEESERRYRFLLEGIKDYAVYALNSEGKISDWNPGAERLYGYKADEIIGQHFACLFTQEDVLQDEPQQELNLASSLGRFAGEGLRQRKDCSRFWISCVIVAQYNQAGQLIGFSKIVQDITLQKQAEEKIHQLTENLERRVEERTHQLEMSNRELESFSYSVSHDLRGPLRAIDGFSQAVMENYADKLDDQGKHYLQRIRDGSQQMSRLIDDILNLSRLTRGQLNVEKDVDLSAMGKEIASELQQQQPERLVRFYIQEKMVVTGDKRLLQIALDNLIGNAWKFTSRHSEAHISFRARQQDGKTIYTIKDDGAGFDMKYANKLFGPFQRLHDINEFPGNGVGLATVARIVHRHRGEIWAEGAVEHGATFNFTLGSLETKENGA